MPTIYEPRGRAREYAKLACNLYIGCPHGCRYCFAPNVLRRDKEEFHGKVAPRSGILDGLRKDAEKLAGDPRPILLCFACDPYPERADDCETTRRAIEILSEHNLKVRVLTKAGWMPSRDFDLLESGGHEFGVTLTCDHHTESYRWEPRASRPSARVSLLEGAKRFGIRTWVSFEPVLDPDAVLNLIEHTHGYVDHYAVGKLNYHKMAKTIDWPDFRRRVVNKLELRGFQSVGPHDHGVKTYYLKRDLVEAA